MKKNLIISLSSIMASLRAEGEALLPQQQIFKAKIENCASASIDDKSEVKEKTSSFTILGASDLADLASMDHAPLVDESETAAVDESKAAAVDESKAAAVDGSKAAVSNGIDAVACQNIQEKALDPSESDKASQPNQVAASSPSDNRDEQNGRSGQSSDLVEPPGNPSPLPIKERAGNDQSIQTLNGDAPSGKSALSRIKKWLNWF